MQSLSTYLKSPRRILQGIVGQVTKRCSAIITNDELYLKLMYWAAFGKRLNLENPQTFSEKLQWLKLYNRKPEYTMMVDKAAVKEYIASVIGKEYVIPTLGVWDSPEEIDWEHLPHKFVLKCTHDSHSVIIVKDKNSLNIEDVKQKLSRSLKNDYYKNCREWPYKDVPHRILAEEYIEPSPQINDLPDYKFFCFNGEVKALLVATERQTPNEEVKFDFFDADFNPLPFRQGHDHARALPQKPRNFELMKEAASKLSQGMPFVRVDLYEIEDNVLFGEYTFFHVGGLRTFQPEFWDEEFGRLLKLPCERLGGGYLLRKLMAPLISVNQICLIISFFVLMVIQDIVKL